MKNQVPYIVGMLHSQIDYAKLIELQANERVQRIDKETKQKVYQKNNLHNPNIRRNRNREFDGTNSIKH